MDASSDWFFWLSSLIIGSCGLTLLIWALFADRARGRRRCPKCWYDMSGATGMLCPECGKTARHESKLFKTRRRWRWIAASAIVFLAAGYLGIQPHVRENGWASIVPNTGLIAAMWMDDPTWAMESLSDRAQHDEAPFFIADVMVLDSSKLWTWQWRMIVARCTHLLNQKDDPHGAKQKALQFLMYAAQNIREKSDVTPIFDMVERFAHEGDPQFRVYAVAALGDDPVTSRGVERMRRFVDDPDEKFREAAGIGIALLVRQSDDALPLVLEMTSHWDPELRRYAVLGLRWYAKRGGVSNEAVDAVREAFSDPNLRSNAFQAWLSFSHLGDEVVSEISNRFQDGDPPERKDVLYALMAERDNHPHALEVLLAALRDQSPDVRREACFFVDQLRYAKLEDAQFNALRLQLQSIASETTYEEVRKAITALLESETKDLTE